MRNDQAGNAAPPQRVVHILLGSRIQGAGGLVQNQNRRIADQCAGNFQPLPLAAAEVPSVFIHRCGVAERPRQYFVMDAGVAGRRHQVIIGNRRAPKRNVVAHGRGEQDNLLVHHRHRPGQDLVGNLIARMAVKQDFTGPGLIQARNQTRKRRFPRTAWTNHCNPLARLDVQAEVLDQRWTRPVVTECNALQLNLAGQP